MDTSMVVSKQYTNTVVTNLTGYVTPTALNSKTLPGNFSSLKVKDVTVLTALAATASFTTFSIGANIVALQAWVTSQSYLTALPSTAMVKNPSIWLVSPGAAMLESLWQP